MRMDTPRSSEENQTSAGNDTNGLHTELLTSEGSEDLLAQLVCPGQCQAAL